MRIPVMLPPTQTCSCAVWECCRPQRWRRLNCSWSPVKCSDKRREAPHRLRRVSRTRGGTRFGNMTNLVLSYLVCYRLPPWPRGDRLRFFSAPRAGAPLAGLPAARAAASTPPASPLEPAADGSPTASRACGSLCPSSPGALIASPGARTNGDFEPVPQNQRVGRLAEDSAASVAGAMMLPLL